MSVIRKHIILTLLICLGIAATAQSPLSRQVTLATGQVTLEKGLNEVSKAGDFSLSYNTDILPVDSLVEIKVQNEKVHSVLSNTILRPEVKFKEYDNYVIIYVDDQPAAKNENIKYQIYGFVRNARTGEVIPYASIYQRGSNKSTLANKEGKYELTVSSDDKYVGLSISKINFLDTVIIVQPREKEQIDISLIPEFNTQPLKPHKVDSLSDEKNAVEEVGIVSFFVPMRVQYHAKNIQRPEKRSAQISFLPFVGSNGLRSGSYTNSLSVNLIAGYANSTEGVEIGGFLNVDRRDMKGVQVAGFGNVVGGKTYGLQTAGFFNTALNSVYGLQFAGFANYAQKTFYGIQLAGFNNMLVGDMKGAQISGFNNLATREFDGIQVAGFSNFAIKGVSRFQTAGFFNYAQRAQIAQVSGFGNLTINEMLGIQVAGFANYSHYLNGLQIAGFTNITSGTMNGLQISGFMNYATNVNGIQLGFINIADSVNGIPIGFFSYALNGYHHLQLSGNNQARFQLQFKTGVDHFYNIFSAGIYPGPDEPLWSYGYGFGTAHTFYDKVEVNIDVTGHTLMPLNSIQRLDNFLGQIDLQAAWKFKKYLSVFAGPSYNIFYSDPAATDIPPAIVNYPVANSRNQTIWGNDVKTWVGFKAGVRF